MNEWIKRGKDDSPANTIRRIRSILKAYDFGNPAEIISNPFDKLYSAQIDVTCYSANGKGATKDLALASGYSELIERIQNKHLNTMLPWFDSYHSERLRLSKTTPQIAGISVHTDRLISTLMDSSIAMGESAESAEKAVADLISEQSVNGQFVLQTFFSLKTNQKELLPVDFLQLFTGTNGMAAGNTIEEAIVQGTCEILERYAAIKILTQNLTPPKIPKSVWNNGDEVSSIVTAIEKDPQYKVAVYDASLGRRIPCVMCVISNQSTQTVGVKFGTYPNLEIAIERCLTEAVQGQDIESFSKSGKVITSKHNRASWSNIHNILKVSHGTYPASLFASESSWQYEDWSLPCEMDNHQRLYYLEKIVEELDSYVLVLNNSFLGFPSVYLYAPGISEIAPVDLLWLQEASLQKNVQQIFTRLPQLSTADLKNLKLLALLKRRSYLDNSLSQLSKNINVFYKRDIQDEMAFLATLCDYEMGDISGAIAILSRMKHTPYTKCVLQYLRAEQSGGVSTDLLIDKQIDPETAEIVLQDFSDQASVICKVIQHCPYNCHDCEEECAQRKVSDLYKRLLQIEEMHC